MPQGSPNTPTPARTFPSVGNSAEAVTPSDSVSFNVPSYLYVGATGDVVVDCAGQGTAVKFANYPVGWLPLAVTKVYSTGTTATNIVRVWG